LEDFMVATVGVFDGAIDIAAPERVEVLIKDDGRLWVNADGICCQMQADTLTVNMAGEIVVKVRQGD
jgi:hypothetical protein